jgi:bifunctional non-homologous end joining protein LigD
MPKQTVRLTHPGRLYWQDAGITKADLADYYAHVWPYMAPFVVGRPLALLRCPGGIGAPCFFQKHAWKGLSRAIHSVEDPQDAAGEALLVIESLDGLIGLVQGGVLEIHPWGATLKALERQDMIIMDLDPGDGVAWVDVISAAKEVRERFKLSGLESFVKTSGGKGLHVVAPLKPRAGWDEVKAFTKGMAQAMAADSPQRYVATVAKAQRHGKILIDYLRNARGATAVAPYSPRARAGAPVSMPLAWEELGPEIGPAFFTLANSAARLAQRAKDPWADFHQAAVGLASSKPVVAKRAASKAAKTRHAMKPSAA